MQLAELLKAFMPIYVYIYVWNFIITSIIFEKRSDKHLRLTKYTLNVISKENLITLCI